MAGIMNLFEGFEKNMLPQSGGYILTERFSNSSPYVIMEMISFGNVKEIYKAEEGITFQADGRKIYVLFEPVSYNNKHTEPCYRDDQHRIPYRFNEVGIYTTRRQNKIMVGIEPVETYTAFTIHNPTSLNISYLINGETNEEIVESIRFFFTQSFTKQLKVSRRDTEGVIGLVDKVLPVLMAPYGG